MATYQGSCHCGDIRFEVVTDLSDPARCNCSYHIRTGGVGHYVPLSAFTLKSGERSLGEYRFGTRTSAFHFCQRCGISVFAHYDWQGEDRYAVNTGCLEGVDPYALDARLIDGRAYR
jgi:hypothetical protein